MSDASSSHLAGRFWRAVRPDRALFGPVFAKETIVSGRRASTYWMRGLFALLIAVVVTLFLWGHWSGLEHRGPAERLQGMQGAGPQLAWFIVWLQFIVVTLIAPALTAACISEEQSNRTLAALMTTPMSAAQIVFGKLSSRMMQVFILVLLSIPALLLLRLLGGLETEAVIAGAAVTLSTAFFAASVGLLLSIVNKRPWSVMVLAEVITGMYLVGPMLLMLLFAVLTGFAAGPGPISLRTIGILAHISPAIALFINSMAGSGAPLPMDPRLAWISASGVTVLVGLLICLLGVSLTRRSMRAEMRGSVRPDRRVKKPRRQSTPDVTPGAAVEERSRASRMVSNDPIFWLEMRTRWVGNKWAAGVLIVLVIGFLGWVYYTAWADREWSTLHTIIFFLLGLAQMLMAIVITTSRISSERQKRTWDVLLATPIPAWRIVMGKLMAGLARLSPIPLLLGAHFVIFSLLGSVRWYTTIELLMLMGSWSVFLASMGLFWSSMFRKPIAASVANLVSAAGLWLAAPLFVLIFFGGIFEIETDQYYAFKALVLINPPYMAFESLQGGLEHDALFGSAFNGRDEYSFMNHEMSPQAFMALVVGSCAVAMALSTLAVAATAARVRMMPRRA